MKAVRRLPGFPPASAEPFSPEQDPSVFSDVCFMCRQSVKTKTKTENTETKKKRHLPETVS